MAVKYSNYIEISPTFEYVVDIDAESIVVELLFQVVNLHLEVGVSHLQVLVDVPEVEIPGDVAHSSIHPTCDSIG